MRDSSRHVIGKDLVTEIHKDMSRSILPSYLHVAPRRFASSGQGVLSADEWKVLCSISLVITLVRVWGYGKPDDSRYFQMLSNYLDLVRAMHVLFSRTTSLESREYYRIHILRYLRTIVDLFPDYKLRPNQHYAVHITEDLETLGPGHARSTPVFERINGHLKNANHNRHTGKQLSFISGLF